MRVMVKPSRRIKLSKNMRPFVSRVVRNGAVQIAFAEQIGRPVGGCVASRVRPGMSGAHIHNIARECAKQAKGVRLDVAGARERLRMRRAAVRAGRAVEEGMAVLG